MAEMNFHILAINPGASSTKLAVFENEAILAEVRIEHSQEELAVFDRVEDQLLYRKQLVLDWLKGEQIELQTLAAVVARGGLVYPLAGGTYNINQTMVRHLTEAENGSHASNLAGLIAYDLAQEYGIPAYTVDPVAVDELEPAARLSGLMEVPRVSKSHALNSKAVARQAAADLGKNYRELRAVTVHLGSGISVAAHRDGRMVDVNNAVSGGPFSVERCGGLPAEELVRLCYSGKYTLREMLQKLYTHGGMYSYLGIKDLRKAEDMAHRGNSEAELVLDAMAYQVAKEVGGMAAVLAGQLDCIILTGSMAYSKEFVERIVQRINWIGKVVTVPGEEEMAALVLGALRVLRGEEKVKEYTGELVG